MIPWRAGLRLCAPALCALPALQGNAAEWSVQSAAQVQALSETNPRLASGGAPDAQSGVADLTLLLSRSTELTHIAIDARGALRRYTRDTALDRDDQQLTLNVTHRGETYELASQFAAARDTTLTSELGTTGIIQDNLRHDSLVASIGPVFHLTERTHAGASVAWQRSRYARTRNTALVDYDYRSAALSVGHDYSENGDIGLTVTAGRLGSDGNAGDISSMDARIKAGYRVSDRWQGSLSAGLSRVRTAGRQQSGSVFSGTLTRQAERYSLNANLGRSVAPTGRGLLSRRDEAGLQVNVRLLENLDAVASYSLVRSRDYVPLSGFSINDVRYTRGEMSMNWLFARDWTLGIAGGRSEQKQMVTDVTGHGLSAWLRVAWRHAAPVG